MPVSGVHLVADVGTSSLKAALLYDNAEVLRTVKIPLLGQPGADINAWDARLWDKAFKDALESLNPPGFLSSITISGHGPSLVPLRGNGSPAGPALLWLNRRTPRWTPEHSSSYFLPAAGWFRENMPGAFEETAVFCSCPGYLAYRLTGVPGAVSPQPEFLPYLWTPEQLSAWGFKASLFPEPFLTGSRIGVTGSGAEAQFGLSRGIPVYAGGPDYTMALIGSGAVAPGMCCDRAGTSEGINFCSLSPVHTSSLRILPHAVSGLYTVAGILASTGRVFEWFRGITNQSGRDYGEMLREIRAADPGASAPRFFPSRHRGPVWDFNNGIFAGLHPEHTHVELGKAVVESIAFGIRDVLDTLENAGCGVSSMRGTGGQYRNRDWNQMKADILGIPLEIPHIIDGELMGNLCAALTGSGRYGNLAEAAEELVRVEHVVEPDRSKKSVYDQLYCSYRQECLLFTSPGTTP